MKILITGGSGYLGSVLCEHLLAKGQHVTVLDNLLYQQRSLLHFCHRADFEFICGDARDERILRPLVGRSDMIIPLAAIVGAPACDEDPGRATAVNLGAITTLLGLRTPSQAVLFPCTNSGYGTRTGNLHCDENTPMDPISLYGRTKTEAERRILEAGNSVSLRLATVFGVSPRMRIDLLVNTFVYEAVVRKYLVIFESNFKRNYLHVRDVADAFLHAIENWVAMRNNVYNVGLDSAILTKAELADRVKAMLPDLYVHFADIDCDPDKRNYIVSSEKLRRAGFTAQRSLEGGIRELISAYGMCGRLDGTNPMLRAPAPRAGAAIGVNTGA